MRETTHHSVSPNPKGLHLREEGAPVLILPDTFVGGAWEGGRDVRGRAATLCERRVMSGGLRTTARCLGVARGAFVRGTSQEGCEVVL